MALQEEKAFQQVNCGQQIWAGPTAYHLPAMYPQTTYSASLSLSVVTCQMEIKVTVALLGLPWWPSG